jgi:dimethylamine/trimethylamine dehydrogenase
MGEEWRKGWHPERMAPKGSDDKVLVVGGGPAGLECAMSLGRRGYEVTLAEAATALGGRVAREAALPGLAAWARVRDYRAGQIERLSNVAVYLASSLTAEDVLDVGAARVVLATGAAWTRQWYHPPTGLPVEPPETAGPVFTPDDVLSGVELPDPLLLFDFDPYYMGGVLAEHLRRQGRSVHLATPYAGPSPWAAHTNEQSFVQARLREIGVDLHTGRTLVRFDGGRAELACVHGGPPTELACASLLVVGSRAPRDELYHELLSRAEAWPDHGVTSVERIGDCLMPGAIVHAVYGGRRYAEELDRTPHAENAERREFGSREFVGAVL